MGDTAGGHRTGLFATMRTDAWWVGPSLTAGGLSIWLIYYAWAALQGTYYAEGPYLSPFYAPLLFADPTQPGSAAAEHAFFGTWPSWWPSFIPASPALFIGLFPGLFRVTCYYYRKAYYRSFFGTPPACAVGAVPQPYGGETGLLIFQNLHRYALYFALLLLPFLYYETIMAFFSEGAIGVGLGSVILLINAVLLTNYTLGCHAWRHLIGGRKDCFSCDQVSMAQHGAWTWSSWLNRRHQFFAWTSLFWILGADVYIRLLSMGIIPDINTWHGVTWAGGF